MTNRGERDVGIGADDVQKRMKRPGISAGTGAKDPSNSTRGNASTCTIGTSEWGCNCSVHQRGVPPAPDEPGTVLENEGIGRLVRKDVLWYLCSVLHLLLPDPSTSTSLGAGLNINARIQTELGSGRVSFRGKEMDTEDVIGGGTGGGGADPGGVGCPDVGGGEIGRGGPGGGGASYARWSAVTERGGRGKGGADGHGAEPGSDGMLLPPCVDGIRLLREGVLDALLGLIACCQRRDASGSFWGRTCTGMRNGMNYSTRENARSGMNLAIEGEGEGKVEAGCTGAGTTGSGTEESGMNAGGIGTGARSSFGVGRRHEGGTSNNLKSTGQAGTTDSPVLLPSVIGNASKLVLDEEEYSMLLGVIERYYWLLSPVV
ncbi:hypothetical protein PM082_013950 [Marasmius tenuissimus]|nr:hypothetical protein PM082_013950 [Marasmius tenuissimus]